MSKLLCILVLVACVAAEAPKISKCNDIPDSACSISQVEVNPCKKIDYCRFKKRNNASIVVDFTPNFTSENLLTGMFWASERGDLPFTELDNADACKYAECPFEIGKPNRFDYSVYIHKRLPSGNFPLKWKLWNGLNKTEACCFMMMVQLG